MNRGAVVVLIAFAVGLAIALLMGCVTAVPRHGGWTPAPWTAAPAPLIT